MWVAALCPALAAAGPILDDFEDGTVENWFVGGGPVGGIHPAPPANIASGGPGGAGDHYMRLTAVGGAGAGSRLAVLNATQWAGDYIGGGVTLFEMDLQNEGNTDLAVRLMFEDPIPGPPANIAISDNPFLLPAGGGWVHATFAVAPSDLVALLGSATGALSNTTILRIFHNPIDGPPSPIVATLGVDNITANAAPAAVPEPAALMLLLPGTVVYLVRRRFAR
jgi:hypothetical protein